MRLAGAVSIRAPVRGATLESLIQTELAAHVSIRAPVRGATLCVRKAAAAVTVSIRAPVRGATPMAA